LDNPQTTSQVCTGGDFAMKCAVCGAELDSDASRCARCGEHVPELLDVAPSYSFTPNRFQFALLFFFSFGLYQIYWLYKTARVLGYITNDKNRPWRLLWLLCPLVNLFFFAELFMELGEKARSSGLRDVPSLPILAFAGIVLNVMGRLPGCWWRLCLLTFVPMTIVQSYSTAMQYRLWPGTVKPYRYRWGDWLLISIGALFFLLVVIGYYSEPGALALPSVVLLPAVLGISVIALMVFISMDSRKSPLAAPTL